MTAEFNVYQVFVGSEFERMTPQPVEAAQAVKLANQCACSFGAKIGSTCRVFITDGGDFVVWEWRHGEGLVVPRRESL